MKRGILRAAVSSLLILAAVPVFAAGPYLGLEGGAVWLSDSSFTVLGLNAGDVKFDTGWSIGGVGGYDFGTWRLEGELVYRSSGVSEISGAIGSFPLDGDVTSTALMVNGYYDFRMISPSIIPYIGAGIGGVNVSADITDPDPVEGGKVLDDSEIVFGYQFIAGVAFPVTKQLTIDLNYRYFATTNPELEISDSGGVTAEVEAMGSNVFLGLRYSF